MSKKEAAYSVPENLDVPKLLDDAKKAPWYVPSNVIGVGIGERRKGGETKANEIVLIVYVKKKIKKDVSPEDLIPPNFQGIATDVVAPFGPDAPQEALGFLEGHQHSDDMSSVDWPKLHQQWTAEVAGQIGAQPNVQDWGNVCVIEDDGTIVKTVNGQKVVDFVQAYKLFRTTHSDDYDFVTFFTDTANGMPPQGGSSWYRFVFNDVKGIGFSPTYNQRSAYGTNKLQGIMFLNQGHFSLWRYVMLQEQGHRWGAFPPYKDTQNGPNRTDHMLSGWGHWAYGFDDDKSCMDYDKYDWKPSNGNFERVSLTSAQRNYCNLDLYLMGLLNENAVGGFYLLSNITNIGGNLYSANKKSLTIQNIIWANGNRVPSVASSQKVFKNAFVVLTGDMSKVQGLVTTVDGLRKRFEADFSDATKGLGRVDTTLPPQCEQHRAAASKYLTLYQNTKNKSYLCSYYYYLALYYKCRYDETKNRSYLCAYRYYLALYYACRYQVTKNKSYLCAYYYYLAKYYACRYQVTKNKSYLCSYYRYLALYYKCRYDVTKNKSYLCAYYYYLAKYYYCRYQVTKSQSDLLAYRRYVAAYNKCKS